MVHIELSHLRTLIAVAEQGSLSAAAEKMYLSSVSVMRQVNQLETELGFKLFFRTRKGCTLTPDGNAFYQKATQILSELDGLIAESKQKTAPETHPLRIGLYKPYDLMEMLEEYKTQHPDQIVEYDAYESYDADHHADWMKSHNLDILQVGYSPSLAAQGLTFFPVYRDQLCCYFTQGSPLAQNETISLSDLADYSVFSYSEASFTISKLAQHFAAEKRTLNLIPGSDSSVLASASNGGVFITEGSLKKEFPHLCCVPLSPSFPIVHGFAYFSGQKRSLHGFLAYMTERIGKANMTAMLRALKERYASADIG